MTDKQRIDFIDSLVSNCPTASFHFNDDPDVTFPGDDPDGDPMPVGYTIRIDEVCDPLRATAPTFRQCVDKLQAKMSAEMRRVVLRR